MSDTLISTMRNHY